LAASRARQQRDTSKLRSELRNMQGSLEARLNALTNAFVAFVELDGIRKQLAAFPQHAEARRCAFQDLQVLLDGGMGSALAVLGVGLMIVGRRVTARMVASATVPTSRVDEALVLDLAAAALACGASLPGALQALGEALEEEELAVAGRALLLGADWDEAWNAPDNEEWRQRRRSAEPPKPSQSSSPRPSACLSEQGACSQHRRRDSSRGLLLG